METQQDFFLFLSISYSDPKDYNHKYYFLVSSSQLDSGSYDRVCT